MKCFIAKSNRELGTCLRVLLADGIAESVVHSIINEKGKMEFRIEIKETDRFDVLNSRYQCLCQ